MRKQLADKREDIRTGLRAIMWKVAGQGMQWNGNIDHTMMFLHVNGLRVYKAGHREFNFDDEVVEPLIDDPITRGLEDARAGRVSRVNLKEL